MTLRKIFAGFFLGSFFILSAQHQEVPERPNIWRGKQKELVDTTSLLGAFRGGTTHGHFRYMFMSTHNQGDLQDFAANAAGGGLRFESARFHGFKIGVSGFYIFNVGSYNLQNPDPRTGSLSRYEIALFDITDVHNTEDMDRLEELFINYRWGRTEIAYGKILLNTPFINLQDGRMRPTGVEGLYVHTEVNERTKLEGGFIHRFSPRSTIRWYNTGESIGVHPLGFDVFGQPSRYQENVRSSGVGILGIHQNLGKNWDMHAWNFFIENVMNTAMFQFDAKYPRNHSESWILGFQALAQHGVGNGGNAEPELAYAPPNHQAYTFGGRIGWKSSSWTSSLNFNRITGHGRYLHPREWGREFFYSFIPRERSEGMGDLTAVSTKILYQKPKSNLKTELAVGYVQTPHPENHALNKYGIPTYTHINLDFHYDHKGILKGLETSLLLMTKIRSTNDPVPVDFIMNRVNLFHTTLALNYHF